MYAHLFGEAFRKDVASNAGWSKIASLRWLQPQSSRYVSTSVRLTQNGEAQERIVAYHPTPILAVFEQRRTRLYVPLGGPQARPRHSHPANVEDEATTSRTDEGL